MYKVDLKMSVRGMLFGIQRNVLTSECHNFMVHVPYSGQE